MLTMLILACAAVAIFAFRYLLGPLLLITIALCVYTAWKEVKEPVRAWRASSKQRRLAARQDTAAGTEPGDQSSCAQSADDEPWK